MTDEKLAKDRMLQHGFTPTGVNVEYRIANSLEYIALYMERIDKKLEILVGDPDKPQPNSGPGKSYIARISDSIAILSSVLSKPGPR